MAWDTAEERRTGTPTGGPDRGGGDERKEAESGRDETDSRYSSAAATSELVVASKGIKGE